MPIEQVTYLKSITIENHLLQLKYYYLILVLDARLYVGPVFLSNNQYKQKIAAWKDIDIIVGQAQQMVIQLWEYDSVNVVSRLEVDLKKLRRQNNLTMQNDKFHADILCVSLPMIEQNQSKIKEEKVMQKSQRKHFIFPLIKTLDQFPINKKNCSPVNLYKSQQSQFYRQPSFVDSILCSETSLQKIMQFSSKGSKIKANQEKKSSVQKVKNKSKSAKDQPLILFDDYQARQIKIREKESQKSKKTNLIESTKRYQQKNYKEANSTASSSVIKKTLKNTIARLTQHPLRIQQCQGQNSNSKKGKNISRQWLIDYGLADNNKKCQNIQKLSNNRSKLNDISVIYDSPELRSYCEKSLSKQQIQNVQSLNSLQLSQSIFQQYGLDISSAKRSNKSREKRKSIIQKSVEQKKQKVTEVKKGKMSQIISAFNVEYKFQDYGQSDINIKSKKVK